MKFEPTVIVLATSACRNGSDHESLVRTISHAVASGLPVLVVTHERGAEAARQVVADKDVLVMPQEAASGTGARGRAIAAGVAARPDAVGWVLLPGDMTQVSAKTLQAVGQAVSNHPAAFSQHRGARSNPVAFGAELFSELVRINADDGARRLLARYPAVGVETSEGLEPLIAQATSTDAHWAGARV